jgi:hypothetical protein
MDLAMSTLIAESLTWISTISPVVASILQNQSGGSSSAPLIAVIISASGAVGAAIGAALIKGRKDTEIAELTGEKNKEIAELNGRKDVEIAELNRQKDMEIQQLRVPQDLQIAYDKDLRDRRIRHYGRLWSLMLPLAKYPEPDPLSYERAKELSLSLRRWYFSHGGLFLTQNTRDKYFNVQDGLKIVAQKREGRWQLDNEKIRESSDHLQEYLQRNKNWKPPKPLVEIAKSSLPTSKDVPKNIFEHLRSLGSDLRTSMAEDVLTRKDPYTGDNISVETQAHMSPTEPEVHLGS